MQKTKTISKIIDKIVMITLISIIVVTTALSIFFTYYRSQNKTINLFGYSVFYVLTGSMEPELEVGDVLLVKIVDPQEINVGDIITYKSTYGLLSGNYITHRVVFKDGEGENLIFHTKGDVNADPDAEVITVDKIKGVYQRKIGIIKFFLSVLSNWLFFFLIIIIPLFIFLVTQLINFFVEFKNIKKDE